MDHVAGSDGAALEASEGRIRQVMGLEECREYVAGCRLPPQDIARRLVEGLKRVL